MWYILLTNTYYRWSNVHPDIELHDPPAVARAGGHAAVLRVSGEKVLLVLAGHTVAEVDLGDEALTPRPGGRHLQGRGGQHGAIRVKVSSNFRGNNYNFQRIHLLAGYLKILTYRWYKGSPLRQTSHFYPIDKRVIIHSSFLNRPLLRILCSAKFRWHLLQNLP